MFGLLMMCIYQNMGIWDIPVELTGKVVEAGWGWEECSLWKYELITLLTSGGEKKRCAVPRVREPGSPVGLSINPLPPPPLCSGWRCPLVEETGICTIRSDLKSSRSGVSSLLG